MGSHGSPRDPKGPKGSHGLPWDPRISKNWVEGKREGLGQGKGEAGYGLGGKRVEEGEGPG